MDRVFVGLRFTRVFLDSQEALGAAFSRRRDQKPDHAVLVSGGRGAGVFSRPQSFSEFWRSWSPVGPAACGSESTGGSDRGRVASRKPRPEKGSLPLCFVPQRAAGPCSGAASGEAAGAGSRRKARLVEGGHGPALKVGAAHDP